MVFVQEDRVASKFANEPLPVGGMIAHVLTFAAHRRTLVVLALDEADITDLGWGDPMQWVAEPSL